jgi:hypothetical protein
MPRISPGSYGAIFDEVVQALDDMHEISSRRTISRDAIKTWLEHANTVRAMVAEEQLFRGRTDEVAAARNALLATCARGPDGNGIGLHLYPKEWAKVEKAQHDNAKNALEALRQAVIVRDGFRKLRSVQRRDLALFLLGKGEVGIADAYRAVYGRELQPAKRRAFLKFAEKDTSKQLRREYKMIISRRGESLEMQEIRSNRTPPAGAQN